ncbi:hypothetical protein A2208_01990 [Candidatus Woesebacteria bacterium RIFOXYA1_FULL_43_16]|nr:MAG: hypothetical protein A2208_01990 [Candidatus Woesebacteria bacterium RIFOXYA1_FULL_43_16]OGM83501.1 MAG: hypothetical protein A2421_01640 [Candidatus Woesebacteria bacterium RIFOXYC1_FULL_43_18]
MISIFSGTKLTSSRIRGIEMATYLQAKHNPKEGYKNDVCIYVKPKEMSAIKDGDWVDFLDSNISLIVQLKDRPKVKVIAASEASNEALKRVLPNEIILIPSHHINQEKLKRTRRQISIGGYIGGFSPMYEEIRRGLKKIGFDFVTCFDFKGRTDAMKLYESIDLLIIGWWTGDDSPHKIPTKIINAASFGIPSIAYPLRGYKEIEGFYVSAHNLSEIITEAEKFKDEDYYNRWAKKISKMAEKYHISKIAKLYKKLKPGFPA